MADHIESRRTVAFVYLRRLFGTTLLRKACAMAVALLAVGIAAPAAAQSLQISGQSFPLTLVGKSVTQTVTLTVNAPDGLAIHSLQIDPSYSEYTLGADLSGCPIGLLSPLGTVCTFSVTFTPQLPGQANSPVPISRSAPLQVHYWDPDLPGRVKVNFALTGTGTGPKGVLWPGVISDIVGSDTNPTPQPGYGGDGGPASGAVFNSPQAIALDVLGNIYITDTQNCVIRVV